MQLWTYTMFASGGNGPENSVVGQADGAIDSFVEPA